MENKIEYLNEELSKLKEFISREEGKKEKLIEQLELSKNNLTKIQHNMELLDKVTIVFQKTSEFAREQAKNQIESLVTKCLQYVFDSNVNFVIELDELRNKANAEFYVVNEIDDIIIKTKPELSRGGGVVDIISLALRI